MFILCACVCVYEENTDMASLIKKKWLVHPYVGVCTCWENILNQGVHDCRNKKDENLLYLHTWVYVCIYMCVTVSMGLSFS